MTTLSTLPTYVVPGRPCELAFALTESGSNFLRVWVTAAPVGSELRSKLDKTTQNRFPVYSGDAGAANPWRTTFDKGGAYTFVAQEYIKGAAAYGGGYQDAPDSAPSETKAGSEATLTLYVGQRMTQTIGVGADTATLVLWVWNETIRRTTLATHGEDSPAIQAVTPSIRASVAMEAALVKSALVDLRDVAVTTALGTLATIVADIRTKYNAHIALGASTHNAADTNNSVGAGYASAPTPAELQNAVNEILRLQRRHFLDDDGNGPGVAAYHQIGGNKVFDYTNAPLYQSVGSLEEAYAALADIWRAHEAHRVFLTVHGASDGTNSLAALPKLLIVHREFLKVLAATSPTVPSTVQSAVVTLIQQAGFAES